MATSLARDAVSAGMAPAAATDNWPSSSPPLTMLVSDDDESKSATADKESDKEGLDSGADSNVGFDCNEGKEEEEMEEEAGAGSV